MQLLNKHSFSILNCIVWTVSRIFHKLVVNVKFVIMDKVTEFHCTTLPADSPYVKPFRMYYTQNGVEKSWDMLKVHDSVAIIILNKTRNTLVLVRQFRPGKNTANSPRKCHPFVPYWFVNLSVSAVYHSIISADPDYENASPESLLAKYPASLAITIELCAGIVDKSKSLVEIAKEEILEECGYNVPIERIDLVSIYRWVAITPNYIIENCLIYWMNVLIIVYMLSRAL